MKGRRLSNWCESCILDTYHKNIEEKRSVRGNSKLDDMFDKLTNQEEDINNPSPPEDEAEETEKTIPEDEE